MCYIYIYMNWIKYTILYTRNMTRTILQIYIEQTKHSTTVKTYIITYVIMYVVSLKIYDWVFCLASLRIRHIGILMLWVQIPPKIDIKFLSCARSPSLISPCGKMSTAFWWQGVLHVELGLKILVYVLC